MESIILHGGRTQFMVENLKCEGCANSVRKSLGEIGFQNISVDVEKCLIEVDTPKDSEAIGSAVTKLKELGYPLFETEGGLTAALLKAKSYISCAIGKIS